MAPRLLQPTRGEVLTTALEKHLRAFAEHAEGAKRGDVPTDLHKLRVATRRLRSLLAVFSDLFPQRQHKRWKKNLKRLGRASGIARDTDVQIDFVSCLLADRKGASGKSQRPGLERLLLRLRQRRAALQPLVAEALNALEKKKIIADMEHWRHKFMHQRQKSKLKRERRVALNFVLCQYIRVLEHDRVLRTPENTEELHALRIAAKHLRYALEFLEPLFNEGFEEQIELSKSWQQALGEIHDCDVWLALLPRIIDEERQRFEDFLGHTDGYADIARGLKQFEADRRQARHDGFTEFTAAWKRECFSPAWRVLMEH